jgi:tripartite-type tricarboxylate transporter receptor subunit TctC
MKIRLCTLVGTALASMTVLANASAAEPYPSAKPVRVIVPVVAGGGVDTLTRLIAQELRTTLGQTFVVENKPGASGNIGMDFVAKSPPDGYTLTVVPNAFTINTTLMAGKLPFDTVKSFTPIVQIGKAPAIVGARAGLPPKSLKELVTYAKARPGQLSYGGCETGSLLHISAEMLKQQSGMDIVQVPYKGCADSLPNVLGGQVDLLFITLSNVASYIQNGRIQAYAVASKERSSFAPNIPTGAEQGFPDFEVEVWYALLGPAGMPQDIVDKLNKAVNDALKKPDVQASMAASFIEPTGGTPAHLADMIQRDIDRYRTVIKKANIHID